MYKHIVLISFAGLLLAALPASAQTLTNEWGSMSSGSDATDAANLTTTNTNDAGIDASQSAGDATAADTSAADTSSISSIDANGNMRINSGEDYTSPIDLAQGNLELGSGATVSKSVRVRTGNVILGSGAELRAGVIVDTGNLTLGTDASVAGNATVGGALSLGANAEITGSAVVRSADTISLGSNADIGGTLTSAGSLQAGANADVKLFLSGQTADIDGKVYPLGGTIASAGSNASIGLPFVPKPKDGSAIVPSGNTINEALPIGTTGSNEQPASSENGNFSGDIALPDVSNILNGGDISKYVSDVISSNTKVKGLDLTSEAVNVDYQTPASLFGFIPMTIPTHIAVSKDKNVDVSYPWYSFLMTTNKDAIKTAVSENVQKALTTAAPTDTASNGLSTKIQALIANSILSAFNSIF
ncbi:MAG: hypothetical protein PHV99_02015 [Candidatus Pacebacteria bacterium]|nr:hypothetical protein [Candidatus Paceibacterota bacterium]